MSSTRPVAGQSSRSTSRARDSTGAGNHRAAIRDAARLLRRLRLPAGASPSAQEPAGDSGVLRNPPAVLGTANLVLRHAWWTIHAASSEVISYLRAHSETGAKLDQSGSGGAPGQPNHEFVGFSFPAVAGVLETRWLLVEVVPLRNGLTGIRADAEVQWLISRPTDEKVPSGVGVIDVVKAVPGRSPSVSKAVTTPSKVRRIIELIDRLPIVQPGRYHCPPGRVGSIDTFTFRATRLGSALAVASVASDAGNIQTACDPMSFAVRGRQEAGLSQARDFLQAVQQLLGVQLTSKPGSSPAR